MTSEAIAAKFDGQQLFAIVETKIEKYPYAEENDEYMPDFLRVYSESTEIDYDPHEDMTFDSWERLVQKVYEGRQEQQEPRVLAGVEPGRKRFIPVSVLIDQLSCFPEPLTPAKGFSWRRQTILCRPATFFMTSMVSWLWSQAVLASA